MVTAGIDPIVQDYLGRVKTIPGVEAVFLSDYGGLLRLHTLVSMPKPEDVDAIYLAEQEVLESHSQARLDFELYNLANLDRDSVLSQIPAESLPVYRASEDPRPGTASEGSQTAAQDAQGRKGRRGRPRCGRAGWQSRLRPDGDRLYAHRDRQAGADMGPGCRCR